VLGGGQRMNIGPKQFVLVAKAVYF